MDRFAKAGANGLYENNITRDVKLALTKSPLESAKHTISLPWRKDATQHVFHEHDVLWPHAAFALLYENHTETFAQRIAGDVGKLHQFWDEMAGNPMFENHPVKGRQNYRDHAVPASR